MKLFNILEKYQYYFYFFLLILFNLLSFFHLILSKKFYSFKLNKTKLKFLYIIEFLIIFLMIFIFQIQLYVVEEVKMNSIYLIIFYIDSGLVIFFLILKQESGIKKELFPKINKGNIINSILLSFPILFLILILIFINKFKNLSLREEFHVPFSFLLNYIEFNKTLSYILWIYPIFITVFIEEYYFRFILEYRHNKSLEIFAKTKESEYIDYLKENKEHWITISILFAIYHLDLNPFRILVLFLCSLYDFYYKSKTKSIIFATTFHFLWDILSIIICLKLSIF